MTLKRSKHLSWGISIGLHLALISVLFISLEKTLWVAPEPQVAPQEKIIDAVVIDQKALQQEVARLDGIEQKKRNDERLRQEAVARQAKEAQQKRAAEEARLADLKRKSEQLKKEAEQQKLVQQQQREAQAAKLKKEEAALKKLAQEKADLLAEKKKIEKEREIREAKKQEQADKAAQETAKVRENELTRTASLMRQKIHQNWRQPIGLELTDFKCKVAVKLLPTGDVLEARVVLSSGSLEFDRSAEVAIRKASPLPLPEDPTIAKEFKQFTFTFHPEAA